MFCASHWMQRLGQQSESIASKVQEKSSQVRAKLPECRVKQADFREFTSCPEPACYSARFSLSNGRELKMELCSGHLRRAVRIAEVEAARMFPGEQVKVASMSFHHLAFSDRRLKAS